MNLLGDKKSKEVTGKEMCSRWECRVMWCAGTKRRKEQNKWVQLTWKQLNVSRRAAKLVYVRWGDGRGEGKCCSIPIDNTSYAFLSENKKGVLKFHTSGEISISSSGLWKKRVLKCLDGMDEWMGCKHQHPLPTLCPNCLDQCEKRCIRARLQSRAILHSPCSSSHAIFAWHRLWNWKCWFSFRQQF